MQSTHKVPGESASRYAAYLTSSSSRGDYYLLDDKGESDRPVPSQWHGSPKTLATLGLSADRPVERGDLRAVMHGRSPADGEPLRPAGSDGTRVAGIEMQFAPPKTVSALWATSSEYRRAQIETAHRKAVASALERTEREVAVVRRKTKGVVRREKAERLLAAEFVHTSSRLARDQEADGIPDPQLHTHLMVFAAQRKDGKLAAVESNQLYKTARENGAWYRAELAANLRELGLQVQRRTGPGERYFELEGVSHELAERWSTRSEDVNRAARVFRQRYGREQARRAIGKEIGGSLTQEQREALQTITGRGGMSVLVGRAGTGKGVVIGTAARAWQLEGNTVIGTAVAGSTAQRLGEEARLDHAHTADKLIRGIEQGHIKLGPDTVVIMDETGMADTKRLAKLTELTGRSQTKFLAVGDSAQLGAIGPGGLFKEIENKVPTAELTEVHRANHEWERKAWEQVRAGEPGPAIASYLAHDRLHIHDTRAQAAQAMVENWDRARRDAPEGRTVMITDASNKERDQINAMAQERRAQAGELGADRIPLPAKPYGLATGDEIIFTAPYRAPGERQVENGITGTILETSSGSVPQTEPEPPTTGCSR